MNASPRHSRYHCSSNQPPRLEQVVKQLRKAADGTGLIKSKAEARGSVSRIDKEYEIRGRSDDLMRFLLNTGILIELENASGLYLDEERSAFVLRCCRIHQEPGEPDDPTSRIRHILGLRETEQPASEDTLTQVQEPAVPVVVSSPDITHVLYLLPWEEDVWNTLALAVEVGPNGNYLCLPSEANERIAWIVNHISCSRERFEDMLARLESSGVMCQAAGKSNCRWTLPRSPFSYHVVRIDERKTRETTRLDIEVARKLMADFVPGKGESLTTSFKAFVSVNFPEANPNSMYTKMVGYNPTYQGQNWGIVYRSLKVEGRTESLLSVPGFESVTLVERKADASAAASRKDAVPEAPERPEEAPQSAVQETMGCSMEAAIETVAEPPAVQKAEDIIEKIPSSVRQLTVKDDEQRRRILENADDDKLDRIINDTTVMLGNLKRTLAEAVAEKQRRETARNEMLRRRRAELQAKRDKILADMKGVEQELAELETVLAPEHSK